MVFKARLVWYWSFKQVPDTCTGIFCIKKKFRIKVLFLFDSQVIDFRDYCEIFFLSGLKKKEYTFKNANLYYIINILFLQTYFGMDIDSVKDPLRRHALKTMVKTYGQTPKQLFKWAHPQRSSQQDTPNIISQLFTSTTPALEVPIKQNPQLPYVVSPSPLPRCGRFPPLNTQYTTDSDNRFHTHC